MKNTKTKFTHKMVKDFKKINKIIFAKGLQLGSTDYFKVRGICCKYITKENKK